MTLDYEYRGISILDSTDLDKVLDELIALRGHTQGGWISVERRVDKAFDLIARANTVTLLSLDEMEAIVNRALKGEFDHLIPATLGDGTICDEGLVRPIQPPLIEHPLGELRGDLEEK